MKKTAFILLLIILTAGVWGQDLPNWNDEQKTADYYFNTSEIANKDRLMSKNINNAIHYFSYVGYLFDVPVKCGEDDAVLLKNGLTLKTFPREGSTDSQIMWTCINDFIRETAARAGEYIFIYICSATKEEFDIKSSNGPMFLYFIGRIESNDSIRGNIWRKP